MQRKPHVARPTALGLAFRDLYAKLGHNTSGTRLPLKREADWTVTRRKKS